MYSCQYKRLLCVAIVAVTEFYHYETYTALYLGRLIQDLRLFDPSPILSIVNKFADANKHEYYWEL